MDFSFEKTNSAYMLFYEWCGETKNGCKEESPECTVKCDQTQDNLTSKGEHEHKIQFELSKDLQDWIWLDNMHFLRDKNIFEHTYSKLVCLFNLSRLQYFFTSLGYQQKIFLYI